MDSEPVKYVIGMYSTASLVQTIPLVQTLLKAGACIEGGSRGGRTLLTCAAQYGDEELVRLLLKHHDVDLVSASTGRFSTIIYAIARGHTGVVRLLLDAGIDPNIDGVGAPLLARAGSPEVIKILLDAGANPYALDEQGNTALYGKCDPRSIQLLLDTGIDPNIRNSDGYTALDLALDRKKGDAVNCLLAGDAKVNTDLFILAGKVVPVGLLSHIA